MEKKMIKNVSDILRVFYKPYEYRKIIIPMIVIKRLNDNDTKKNKEYCNLLKNKKEIKNNFIDYLKKYNDIVQNILEELNFYDTVDNIEEEVLYLLLNEFNKYNLKQYSNTEMGYIFEEVIKEFSESYLEYTGEHFTSRDIVYLMTDLLLSENQDSLQGEDVITTVYDQTMGTSQMLSAMTERIHQLNPSVDVKTYGQELNGETYAIAKADTMIRGGESDNMRKGNTLSNDQFSGYTFDYCISNPPFGVDWKTAKDAVTEEHERGAAGRFAPGLPKISDGQLLFQLNGLSKLKENGRMAIIHNGSALFSGNAGGGESAIRQYVIENDWLEAIIQLPNDLFYNTGIATYIWVLTKNKSEERRGKVQLIDASKCFKKRRKNIGNKRVDITTQCRELIVKVFKDFSNETLKQDGLIVESKVYENQFFGYTKVTVESPLKDEDGNIVTDKKGKPKADKTLKDTEDIPLTENIDEYFEREVKLFNPDAWMERKKDKIGYEIPFTRLFYKYEAPEPSEDIAKRIQELEEKIQANFNALLSGGQAND